MRKREIKESDKINGYCILSIGTIRENYTMYELTTPLV